MEGGSVGVGEGRAVSLPRVGGLGKLVSPSHSRESEAPSPEGSGGIKQNRKGTGAGRLPSESGRQGSAEVHPNS
ncbi:hypothetical protein T484DRAFT_1815933 [Baffinella frigidus]|nr:hypothetical protein T484DRAFT_1815933 [Cryptophyta sp. CCMP2293]